MPEHVRIVNPLPQGIDELLTRTAAFASSSGRRGTATAAGGRP